MQLYREVLTAFVKGVPSHDLRNCTLPVVQTYLTGLRGRVNPTTAHLHFSKLRAFFRRCVESGLLEESPLRGVTVRLAKNPPACSRGRGHSRAVTGVS